jgi:hypothetical protein
MIITPDFVFINNPRTGTTFARKAIRAAYGEAGKGMAVQELILPIARGRGQNGTDHHGTFAQIPAEFRDRPVSSGVRNPFTLLVAIYELGLWRPAGQIPDPSGEPTHLDPTSFLYFLRSQELAIDYRWEVGPMRPGFGPLSLHHLQMFAVEPRHALERVAAGAGDSEIEQLIGPISFLKQENLREDLCSLLTKTEARAQIEAVRAHPPSHVTKRSQPWCRNCFNEDLVNRILQREAFLFRTLSRRGIKFTFENAEFEQQQRKDVRL